jgi:hypothetical protein
VAANQQQEGIERGKQKMQYTLLAVLRLRDESLHCRDPGVCFPGTIASNESPMDDPGKSSGYQNPWAVKVALMGCVIQVWLRNVHNIMSIKLFCGGKVVG